MQGIQGGVRLVVEDIYVESDERVVEERREHPHEPDLNLMKRLRKRQDVMRQFTEFLKQHLNRST